ncbi:putative reverse transcriptase domain-containing protein [Tanacetum coccineum]
MPCGLTNAPAVFMDLMNQVCKPYLDNFMIVFIDDILIYSKNKNEHEGHLKLILSLLQKEELFTKFSKCKFWLSKVKFLGHVIDSEGIHVDPTKIESVKDWAPMTKVTQKSVKFDWGEKEEAAFQLLKQKLCSAPILALPEGSENFVVYCDASYKGLGAVLMQREKVIAYASRQLKRQYLYGTKCVVFTDQKELNMRQRRWLELLRLNLPKQILNAQAEARKEENYITEDLHVCSFPTHERGRINGEVDKTILKEVVSRHGLLISIEMADSLHTFGDYRLELPEQLSRVHSTFHVSNLKKCLSDKTLDILLDEIQIDDKLYFIEEPAEIMDREVKRLKQSRIPIVKVRWNSRREPEFTWKREDQMKKKYPHLFANSVPMANVTS